MNRYKVAAPDAETATRAFQAIGSIRYAQMDTLAVADALRNLLPREDKLWTKIYLATRRGAPFIARPNYSRLGRICDMDRRTVRKALPPLLAAGKLEQSDSLGIYIPQVVSEQYNTLSRMQQARLGGQASGRARKGEGRHSRRAPTSADGPAVSPVSATEAIPPAVGAGPSAPGVEDIDHPEVMHPAVSHGPAEPAPTGVSEVASTAPAAVFVPLTQWVPPITANHWLPADKVRNWILSLQLHILGQVAVFVTPGHFAQQRITEDAALMAVLRLAAQQVAPEITDIRVRAPP